jgi:RND family efflux transporter MFP subunit
MSQFQLRTEISRRAVVLGEAVKNTTPRDGLKLALQWIRTHRITTGAAVITALAIVGTLATRPAPAAQDAAAAQPIPAVEAVQVKLTRIAPQIALAGTVVSRNDSHLAAEVEGRVAWVAEVGTIVQAGDVVAKLDNSVAATQLANDKANVARLQAQLSFGRSQAERMNNLFAQNAIAKATRDEAVSTRDMDQGALAQAQAALNKSQYQYDHETIKAPFAGRVVARLINPGEYASVGKEIARLVDVQSLEISAQAPIDSAQYIHEGMSLATIVEDKQVSATVRAIVPVGDQLSRTVEVRLTLAPGAVLVGDSARVMIPTAPPRQAIAVPRDALLLREDATYIFKLDRKNTALRVAVETGSAQGDLIEVHGPVAPGDRVIVRGAEQLQAGQKVRVKRET